MKAFDYENIPNLNWQHAVKKPIPIRVCQIDEPFTVESLEGTLTAKAGDYLVIGIRGEMYAMDQEIFRESYDVVDLEAHSDEPQ